MEEQPPQRADAEEIPAGAEGTHAGEADAAGEGALAGDAAATTDATDGPRASGEEMPGRAGRFFGLVPRWARITIAVVLFFGLLGSVIHLPYYAIGPGVTRDMLGAIDFPAGTKTYPSKGKLLITTAAPSVRTLTVWESLVVWISPTLSTIDARVLVPEGVSDTEQDAINFRDIEVSKIEAERAAFKVLGARVRIGEGARVLSVVEDAPADGKLKTGDVVVAVNERTVTDSDAVQRAIRRSGAGKKAALTVRRGGKDVTVTIVPTRSPEGSARVGVYLGPVYRMPYDVRIETERIGGPSGGLVFALSVYDLLTPGDLTRGRTVAVTGTIDAEGRVDNVGAVHEKVRAAVRDGATVFVMPRDEVAVARTFAPRSLRLIGVSTLSEAIKALRSLN